MRDSDFSGVPPDTAPSRPKLFDVVSPKAGVTLDCTSLESRVLGLLTHFIYSQEWPRGRSRFCDWEQGNCRWCHERHVQVWQGYLGCYCHSLCKRIVLCLGKESALALSEWASTRGGIHLLKFRCRKPETGPKSALEFLESKHIGAYADPDRFNILPSVAAVLGVPVLPEYRYTPGELTEGEVPNA